MGVQAGEPGAGFEGAYDRLSGTRVAQGDPELRGVRRRAHGPDRAAAHLWIDPQPEDGGRVPVPQRVDPAEFVDAVGVDGHPEGQRQPDLLTGLRGESSTIVPGAKPASTASRSSPGLATSHPIPQSASSRRTGMREEALAAKVCRTPGLWANASRSAATDERTPSVSTNPATGRDSLSSPCPTAARTPASKRTAGRPTGPGGPGAQRVQRVREVRKVRKVSESYGRSR